MGWRSRLTGWAPKDHGARAAYLAIFLSVIQLPLTIPVIAQWLFSPRVVISGMATKPTSKSLAARLIVENTGNATATKVEIGLRLPRDQRLVISPNYVTKVVDEETDEGNLIPSVLKTRSIRIEIERLLAGEKFVLTAISIPNPTASETERFFTALAYPTMPAVEFVRTAEVRGDLSKISPSEFAKFPVFEVYPKARDPAKEQALREIAERAARGAPLPSSAASK
jgi:hypothetical protein